MKILDSDHWIALLRGRLDLRGRVAADQSLAITAISIGELVYGAERSARPAVRLLEVDALLSSLVLLDYDDAAAHRFGSLKAELERRGERLDAADLQIAAIVLSHAAALVTHNQRHFRRVPGIVLEDWLGVP
jgi:tRNA(fMet)-specific endonuclease VapC